MKKTILTISLLVLMTSYSTSFAQSENAPVKKERKANLSPEEVAKRKTDQMTKSLGLDKDQEKSMYAINLKHAKEHARLKVERQALRAKYQEEKNAHRSNVNEVLTDEQRAKLAEIKARKAEKQQNRRHPHPPKPPVPPRVD